MIVYLCGKINDTEGCTEKFETSEIDVRDAGYTPINPIRFNQLVGETNYDKRMRINLALLDMSDGIYLIDGFKTDSPSANMEIGFAMAKGMRFMEQADLVKY